MREENADGTTKVAYTTYVHDLGGATIRTGCDNKERTNAEPEPEAAPDPAPAKPKRNRKVKDQPQA